VLEVGVQLFALTEPNGISFAFTQKWKITHKTALEHR